MLVMCHGDMTDETQRVCTINNSGEVLSYCSVRGTPWPAHLTLVDAQQVYVAFRNTEQVRRTGFTDTCTANDFPRFRFFSFKIVSSFSSLYFLFFTFLISVFYYYYYIIIIINEKI